MKKLLVGLIIFLGLASPALAQQPALFCNNYYQVNQGATSIVKVISGTLGKSIGFCGYALNGGAAASTFTMAYGTGTNCNTGAVTLIPLQNVAINGTVVDHVPFVNFGPPSQNASGVANDVCITTTGTGPLSIILYYLQF